MKNIYWVEKSKKWIKALEIPYLADMNKKIYDCQIEGLIKIVETNFNIFNVTLVSKNEGFYSLSKILLL